MKISTQLAWLIVDEGFDPMLETSLEATRRSRRRGTGSPCVRFLQQEKAMKGTNGLRRQTIAATVAAVVISFGLLAYSSGTALADPPGYTFTLLATLGGPTPGPDTFDLDFEPHSINAAGNVAFVADLKSPENVDIGEGVFASR